MDDFIQEGKNLFPYLQVGAKVGVEHFSFIHGAQGVRYLFIHHPLVQEAAAVFDPWALAPFFRQPVQHSGKAPAPFVGLYEFCLLLFGKGWRRCVQIPVSAEFPCLMVLPGTDAVGEYIVFQPVHVFFLPFRQEEGFQHAENGFPLPAAVFSAAFRCEEADQAAEKHHQGMVVHGMFAVDETGDFIALEGSLKGIDVVLRIPEKYQNVPEAEVAVPHQGQNGSRDEIHFLRPVGGGDEMKSFVGNRIFRFGKAAAFRAPVEERAGHGFQVRRGKTAVLGQSDR